MTRIRPPLWGNFVDHADWDLLSFCWLYQGGLLLPGLYHATQAVEKYLKALTLSILDPDGETETALNNRWLRTHDLVLLAERCVVRFPFYGNSEILTQFRRFSEFDLATRYPWVKQKHGNGLTSAEIPLLCDLMRQLRTDLPIKVDDYILGMLVRGHHHGRPEAGTNNYLLAGLAGSLAALQRTFPEVDRIVRW